MPINIFSSGTVRSFHWLIRDLGVKFGDAHQRFSSTELYKEIYDCNEHAMMQKVIVERARIVALRLKKVRPERYGSVPNAPEVQFGRHRTVPVAVNVLIMLSLSGV